MVGLHGRSGRFKEPVRMTSPRVAPGCYHPCENWTCQRSVTHAPFLSWTPKMLMLVTQEQLKRPPPNLYSPHAFRLHRVTGGDSPGYLCPRFTKQQLDAEEGAVRPGPADYGPPISGRRSPSPARSNKTTPRKKAGHLKRGRLTPYEGAPPSIPPKGSKGYRRVPPSTPPNKWELVPIPPPGPTPGPEAYDLNKRECCTTTHLYRGNFWSRMSPRRDPRPTPGPGPAAVNLRERLPGPLDRLQAEWPALREERRRNAYLPRYTDMAVLVAKRMNYPSPAAYNTRTKKVERPGAPFPPFLVGSRRFVVKRMRCPGPTDTDYPHDDMLHQSTGMKMAPFLSTTDRGDFWPKSCTPGPAAYALPRGLAEEGARHPPPVNVCAPFGASEPRRVSYQLRDPSAPGPALYQKLEKVPKMCLTLASLKSVTARNPPAKVMWLADPTTYDVSGAARKLYSPTSHRCRRVARRAPFLCGEQRFGRVCDWPLREIDPTFPGPSEYDTRQSSVANPKLGSMPMAMGLEEEPTPGPADYYIHRLLLESCVTPTFNAKLPNPIPRPRPLPSPLPYVRRVAERKKLRAFAHMNSF